MYNYLLAAGSLDVFAHDKSQVDFCMFISLFFLIKLLMDFSNPMFNDTILNQLYTIYKTLHYTVVINLIIRM